jgi:hypothetical protein
MISLFLPVPGVVLLDEVVVDPREHRLREGLEEVPSDVQSIEDGPILISALVDELLLEGVGELQDEPVPLRESFLTDDGDQATEITALCIIGVELVRDRPVVLSSVTCVRYLSSSACLRDGLMSMGG